MAAAKIVNTPPARVLTSATASNAIAVLTSGPVDPNRPAEDGGCGCAITGGAAQLAWGWLPVAMLIARRRRRPGARC